MSSCLVSGLLIVGGQRMRAAMASQGNLPTPSTSTEEEVDGDVPEGATAAAPPSGSGPLVVLPGQEVKVNPDLQTILDTGEFKLVRHMVEQRPTSKFKNSFLINEQSV